MIKPTLLASTLAFALAGCGGGEGGGGGSTPSVPYFKANFVYLESVDVDTKTACRVYDYGYDSTSDTPEIPTTKVIGYTANPNSGYSIVIHNADGSVVSKYSRSDWGSSATSYRFKQSEVPTNGYVSFLSRISLGSGKYSYQVSTYAKNLLPDTVSVFAGGSYGSPASTNCITGSNTTYKEYSGYIYQAQSSSNDRYFGFNTYQQSLEQLSSPGDYYSTLGVISGGISFYAPTNKRVLGVSYSRSGTDITGIEEYAFLPLSALGTSDEPVELTAVDNNAVPWYIPTDDATLSSANIHVYTSNTGAVLWQPLTTDEDGTFGYTSDISNYYLTLAGSYLDTSSNAWTFQYVDEISAPSSQVDSATTISDLNLPSVPTVAVGSCSVADSGSCFAVDLDSSSFDDAVQRLKIYNTDDSMGTVNQVIYADYSAEVPVMSFDVDGDSDANIDDILTSGSGFSSELSLLSQDASALDTAFLYNQQDLVELVETNINEFNDSLPLIETFTNYSAQQNLFKYTPHILLQASSD